GPRSSAVAPIAVRPFHRTQGHDPNVGTAACGVQPADVPRPHHRGRTGRARPDRRASRIGDVDGRRRSGPLHFPGPGSPGQPRLRRLGSTRTESMEETINLNTVIDQVCREKNISRQVLAETVEQAVLAAAKKVFEDREIEASFDPETGHVNLFQVLYVVDEVDMPAREISVEQAQRSGLEAE